MPLRPIEYDLFEHRHRFSTWAAARAAQRRLPGARVSILKGAIEASGLRELAADQGHWPVEAYEYDSFHRRAARRIIDFMDGHNIAGATYGRAAKLIAIYFKTMIVNGPHGETQFAAIIH